MQRSSFFFAAAIALLAVSPLPSERASAQGGAWCEANCKDLCRKIYGRAGASECFATIPCANYAGRKCAPADVVQSRYVVYCHNNKGKAGTTCR
jgi:hypothetical protein